MSDRRTDSDPDGELSRRKFLEITAAAGLSVLGRVRAAEPSSELLMPPGVPNSRVIHVQSPYVVDGPVVHRVLLREMLDKAVAGLVPDVADASLAWKRVLKPDDVIGIKFNRSAQEVISTTDAIAGAIVESLVAAGWASKRIVLIEAPPETTAKHSTTAAVGGFSTTVTDFGSGADQFAAVLGQVSALIDVPYLKTHNIAGITCALKNLSHGLVKHPARYHGNRCSPFIPDIVSAPPIRTRLRLCIVDALRVVYAGGPEASVETISDEGALLVSADPVAIDSVGLALLNDVRKRRSLPMIASAPANLGYLAEAHRSNLGIAIPHGIDVIRLMP